MRQLVNKKNHRYTQRKKLPNLGSNSWFPFQTHTDSLMVRWYEPGRETMSVILGWEISFFEMEKEVKITNC